MAVEYFENTNTQEILADITLKGVTKEQKLYAVVDATTNTFKTSFKIDRTR